MARYACFVTGTDTEVGKTLIAAGLLVAFARRGISAAGMKPIAAGARECDGRWINDDVEALARASTVALPPELVCPYLLRDPVAPHLAAAACGIALDIEPLLSAYAQIAARAEAVVVEGVGGFRVPLDASTDTADLAQRLGLPVVLVVGLRLGCLNHALLTAEAIRARGLALAGWVANRIDPAMRYAEANVRTLAERLGAPLLGSLPHLAAPDPALAAGSLDIAPLLAQS